MIKYTAIGDVTGTVYIEVFLIYTHMHIFPHSYIYKKVKKFVYMSAYAEVHVCMYITCMPGWSMPAFILLLDFPAKPRINNLNCSPM